MNFVQPELLALPGQNRAILVCWPIMKRTTPLEGLARWVRRRLQGLVWLDKSLTDHLEATFGSADMTAIVADPTGSESASFLELLFFPDAPARLEFEHRWGASVYSKKDQDLKIKLADYFVHSLSEVI